MQSLQAHAHCIVSRARHSWHARRGKTNVWSLETGFRGRRRNVGGTNQIGERSIITLYWSHDPYRFKQEHEQICDRRVLYSCKRTARTTDNHLLLITDVAEQWCRQFLVMMSRFSIPPCHGNLSIVTRRSFPLPPCATNVWPTRLPTAHRI